MSSQAGRLVIACGKCLFTQKELWTEGTALYSSNISQYTRDTALSLCLSGSDQYTRDTAFSLCLSGSDQYTRDTALSLCLSGSDPHTALSLCLSGSDPHSKPRALAPSSRLCQNSLCYCWGTLYVCALWHLPPDSARILYATVGALCISVHLSTDAVSALRNVFGTNKTVKSM